MAHQDSENALEALEYLQPKLPVELRKPAIGIICGSGLGGLADVLLEQPQVAMSYSDIPHFAKSTGSQTYGGLVTSLTYVQALSESSAWSCWKARLWFIRSRRKTCSLNAWKATVSIPAHVSLAEHSPELPYAAFMRDIPCLPQHSQFVS